MDKVFLAKVSTPTLTKRKISCKCCDISYDGVEYGILMSYEKIVYFDFFVNDKKKIKVCNDCLLFYSSFLCNKHKIDKLKILIDDGKDKSLFSSKPFELEAFDEELLDKIKKIVGKKPI